MNGGSREEVFPAVWLIREGKRAGRQVGRMA